MSNFPPRLDRSTSSTPLSSPSQTRKTSSTEQTQPPVQQPGQPPEQTTGNESSFKAKLSGGPKPESVLSSESETQLSQMLDSSSPKSLGKSAKKLPRVSGISQTVSPSGLQTGTPPLSPNIKPSETVLSHVTPDKGVKSVKVDYEKTKDKIESLSGKPKQETSLTPEEPKPNQMNGVVTIGLSPDTRSVRGKFTVSNMGNSGVTLALSGGITMTDKTEFIDNDKRILQTRARGGDVSVGVSGVVDGSVPVSGSIGVGVNFETAYARQLKPGESLKDARDKTKPPSRDSIALNPTQTLNPGDEIAFRGQLTVGVSVGAVEPNSGVKFSVGVDVKNEFITAIKRNEGEPPTFRLHIEPSNRNIDGNASVGWGPFAIKGGMGYASTVYYEFDMTPEALTKFLNDGKLPPIPDPSSYLRPGKVLTTDTFKPFQDQAKDTGVTIVGFGATKSISKSLELSATAGKVSTSSEKMRAVYVQNGEVLREDVHTMIASRSAWFKGELSTSLALTQGNRYTEETGKTELKAQYVGLQASFQIADSKTSQSDLNDRVDHANHLLGRAQNNPLEIPLRSDGKWANSSMQIKANITPDVIERLSNLDHSKGDVKFQIEFMENNYGIPAKDVRKLIDDLKSLSVGPDLDVVRREQGLRIAGFLASGYTSVVNDQELKRIAVLDRMLGGGVAELGVASNVHTQNIDKLAVDGFLSDSLGEITRTISPSGHDLHDLGSRLTGDDWKRFNVAAQKVNSLEQIRQDISNDTLLDSEEQTRLLKNVDEKLDNLGKVMGNLLETESGRAKVIKGMLEAGSVLPKAIYTSPEEMYDDPMMKSMLLDQVIGNAFLHDASPKEFSDLITSISKNGTGNSGIEQVFKILNKVESPEAKKEILDGIEPKAIADLFPRMNREQQSEFLITLQQSTTVDKQRMSDIMGKIEKSREKSDEQFDKLLESFGKLEKEMTKLEGDLPKDKHLMDHFKQGHKEVERPLQKLQDKIHSNRDLLGQMGHDNLIGKTQELEGRLVQFFNQMEILTPDQRQNLFQQLLKQDSIGQTSHALLNHLIAGSQSEDELAKFGVKVQNRLLENDKATRLPHRVSSLKENRIALQEALLSIHVRGN